MEFSFLIDETEFTGKDFKVTKSQDYEKNIKFFHESYSVSNGWIYPHLEVLRQSAKEKQRSKQEEPTRQVLFYSLPVTHEISTSSQEPFYEKFLIMGYGFLQGLYLSPKGHHSIMKTAYERGKLHGLHLMKSDYVKGMNVIGDFYKTSNSEKRTHMFAIMHWFLLSQSYDYQWDVFDAQYKVLDGLYKINDVKAKSHTQRPVKLAEKYNLVLPKWAEIDSSTKKSVLSQHRNELVHEAKYAGEPIGYNYPKENYSLELVAFNTKLIAATLGLKSAYISIPSKDRNTHGWKFLN